MDQHFETAHGVIAYTLRRSARARRLRISVAPGGEVIVTVPRRVPLMFAHSFLKRKAVWLEGTVRKMKQIPKRAASSSSPREFRAQKNAALRLVKERVAYFNARYGFLFRKITIRNQKTRWGSCSKQGNLSFNYRIVLLPPELADYLIVHELCHLQEMNHSKQFWLLVEQAIPNAKQLRKKLRSYRNDSNASPSL